MIPEVLGKDIYVNPAYMDEMPDGYVNQADFIRKFEAKQAERNKRHIMKMDTNYNKNKNGTNDCETMEAEEKVNEEKAETEKN
ncbi:unnamed protein product [Euphydryas editha]|nr:unnamed protein product [Euphydryas editha]